MSRLITLITQIYNFFRYDIWQKTDSELTKRRRLSYDLLKTILLAIRGFVNKKLNIRASALTYSIVFAIIPLFSLIIAIGKGLGVEKIIEDSLKDTFIGQSNMTTTVMGFVQRYLETTQKGLFIGVGIGILLWSVMNLFMQVENAFNSIWQVKKPRPLVSKFTTYFSTVLIIPILIVVSGGLSIYVSSAVSQTYVYEVLTPLRRFLVKLVPYILNCIVFTIMYKGVPNTKVQFKSAMIAGIIGGCAFQAFQMLYINGQVYLSRYNVVYGSFAAIPLLLLWIQISCLIALLGAEISYVYQNLHYFESEKDAQQISSRYKNFLTLFILYIIVKQFEKQKPPLSDEEISHNYKIPIRIVQETIHSLINISVISEIHREKGKSKIKHYIPAIDINQLTVNMINARLNEFGTEDFLKNRNELLDAFWQKTQKTNECENKTNQVLIKDL